MEIVQQFGVKIAKVCEEIAISEIVEKSVAKKCVLEISECLQSNEVKITFTCFGFGNNSKSGFWCKI